MLGIDTWPEAAFALGGIALALEFLLRLLTADQRAAARAERRRQAHEYRMAEEVTLRAQTAAETQLKIARAHIAARAKVALARAASAAPESDQ